MNLHLNSKFNFRIGLQKKTAVSLQIEALKQRGMKVLCRWRLFIQMNTKLNVDHKGTLEGHYSCQRLCCKEQAVGHVFHVVC